MLNFSVRRIIPFLGFIFGFNGFVQAQPPADYVNPFIGASTNAVSAKAYHGLGKTFPGAAYPFGMVQVSPNTVTGGDNGSGYSYEHTSIEGFAFTQMSGVGWYGDLGNLLVMPTVGASSMIYAMIGIYLGIILVNRKIKIVDTRKYLLFVLYICIGLAVSLLKPSSNFFAHAYSLFFGFIASMPKALRRG